MDDATVNRYPFVVEMPLTQEHFFRDPRKVWLYDTFKGSRWVCTDMHRIHESMESQDNGDGVTVLNPVKVRWPVRLFRFVNEHEALMFQLRWASTTETAT